MFNLYFTKLKTCIRFCKCLLIFFFIPIISYSQLQLNLSPPPVNTLREVDLMQFTVNNMMGTHLPTVFKIQVSNAQKENVFFLRTAVMRIAPGTTRFSPENLQITDMAFLSDSVRRVVAATKQFPSGLYTICVEAIDQQSRMESGRNCINHTVVNTMLINNVGSNKGKWKDQVNFYGFGNLETMYATRQGTNQQVPPAYTRFDFRPGLELGPVPLEMNLFYSSEESRSRQQQYVVNFRFNEQRFKSNLINLASEVIRKRQMAKAKELNDVKNKLKDLEKYSKAMEDPELLKDVENYSKLSELQNELKSLNVSSFEELEKKLSESNIQFSSNEIEKAKLILQKHKDLQLDYSTIDLLVSRNSMYRKISEKVNILNAYKTQISNSGLLEQFKNSESFDFSQLSNPEELKKQLKSLGLYRGSNRMLYNVRGLAFGNIYPTHSFLTLDGVQLFGGLAEMNLGNLYLSFTSGQSLRQTTAQGIPFSPYNQTIVAGKVGYGRVDASHFYIGFVRGLDNVQNDTSINRPKDNLVISPELQISLLKKKIILKAEGAASQFTRDQFAEELELAGYSSITDRYKFLPKPNISTFADWAYSITGDVNIIKQTTVLHLAQVYIGPGYRSIGTPFLRNDLLRREIRLNQSIFKSKVVLSAFYRLDLDNNFNFKGIKTQSRQFGAGADVVLPKLPFFRIRYTPVFQENSISTFVLHLGSFQSGYSYKIKKLPSSTNISYMNGFSESNLLIGYNTSSLNISQNITLPLPLMLTLTWSSNTIENNETIQKISGLEVIGSLTLKKRLINSLALNYYNRNETGGNIGGWYEISSSFLKVLNAGLRVEYNSFNDRFFNMNSFSEWICRARIGMNF